MLPPFSDYLIVHWGVIAVLTRELGGWEQAAGLITTAVRSRVEYLVLARSAGTRCLTKSAPRFTAAKLP